MMPPFTLPPSPFRCCCRYDAFAGERRQQQHDAGFLRLIFAVDMIFSCFFRSLDFSSLLCRIAMILMLF